MATPGTNAWAQRYWGSPGDPRHIHSPYEFYPGVRITTDIRAKDAFLALGSIMARHGYKVRRADTGAYNKRYIAGTKVWSNHSWGLAVDVNWNSNPYASRLITDMPQAMVDEILKIKTRNGKTVFRWGGYYRRKKDAMHFEVMVTPADLATGLVIPGGTPSVQEPSPTPAPVPKEGIDMITQGSTGPYVLQVQRLVNGVNYRSFASGLFDKQIAELELDGKWGPKSQDALAHAMLRADKATGVSFASDYELSTVTPAMVTHLYYAAARLGVAMSKE